MKLRLSCAVLLTAFSSWAQAPAGRWDGTIVFGTVKFPFTMFFEGGGSISGSFENGGTRVTSTSGSFENGVLRLSFGRLGTRLEAKLSDGGALNGDYGSEKTGLRPVTASAYCTCAFEGEAGPEIMGTWEVPDIGWRLVLTRKGEDTLATLTRPDGKLGPLAGRFDGAVFTLRYFDGAQAAVLEIEQRKDNGLDLVLKDPDTGIKKYTATRANSTR